jgi:hypothetical protein
VHHRRPLPATVGAMLLLLCVVVPAVSGLMTGASWYNATDAAAFMVRTRHTSAVFNGGGGERMWVIGGYAPLSATYYNDTWSSADGTTWTPGTTNAGFLARAGHSSAVFRDRLWVIGGFGLDGDGLSSSTATSGTQQTGSPGNWQRLHHPSQAGGIIPRQSSVTSSG